MKNINYNVKYIKNLIIFTFIFLSGFSCQKKYNLVNAPVVNSNIADFEKLFNKHQYDILINKINYIKNKCGISCFILTINSFNNKVNDDLEKLILQIEIIKYLIRNLLMIIFE